MIVIEKQILQKCKAKREYLRFLLKYLIIKKWHSSYQPITYYLKEQIL